MNKEFKVGDKVTSQLDGKGFVVGVKSHSRIEVAFLVDGDETYNIQTFTKYGFRNELSTKPELFHGHGTFEFVVDKEPEYEYKILYQSESSGEYYLSTGYYKSAQDYIDEFPDFGRMKNVTPIQETKREVK